MAGKSIDTQAIANRFKVLMRQLGFDNPREMAIAMGYDRPDNLYNAVNGDRMPGVPLLIDVSNKFENANINFVLTGKGNVLLSGAGLQLAEEQSGYLKKGSVMITLPEQEWLAAKESVKQLQTIFAAAVFPGKLSLPTEDLVGKEKRRGSDSNKKGSKGTS